MNTPNPDELDVQDMSRLTAGHEAALNGLMERHAGKLFNYLVRCLQNEDDAADAAQETFVKVYQSRARFDPDQRFSTWLYTIAANLVKDRYRWRSRHPQISLDAESDATGDSFRESLPGNDPLPHERAQTAERSESHPPRRGRAARRTAPAAHPRRIRGTLTYGDRGDARLLGKSRGDAHLPRPPATAGQLGVSPGNRVKPVMKDSEDSLRGSARGGVVACNCPNRQLRSAGQFE
jgi:RNA polymerase sigma factor (sigma-70 family)